MGRFLQDKRGYRIKVFNSIDFSKSMHYNPLAYIKTEANILKFVDTLIANTKGEGKEGYLFWTEAETLLYCTLIAYIIFEGLVKRKPGCFTVKQYRKYKLNNDVVCFKTLINQSIGRSL